MVSSGQKGKSEVFSSRWGLIFTALGAAIGTGNIWRFPKETASNGGGALQLGPDNKIYVTRREATSLGVINSPNTLGVGCNYIDNGVSLAGRKSLNALPNFIQSFFFNIPI